MSKIILGVWDGQVLDNREQQRELPAFAQVEALGAFETDATVRAILGWDGFFLFTEDADPVDLARAYMAIVQEHSCGKCIPCRMGTRVAAEVLARIADGHGRESDLTTLRQVGELVQAGSLCELGHTSMNAVLALISAYEDAFLQAIREGTRRPRGTYHAKVTAPCIEACPERLDIPRYIENIKAGRYSDSLMVIQEKNPLASVCGRVCVRFCEFACRRGQLDDPINIKHLKRFVSDVEMDSAVKKVEHSVVVSPDAPRIAIIGAGPAGMTAAYHLLHKGYRAEIFEALGEPGGMAAVGIPDYRLPREVLRSEIQVVEDMGAKVHYHQVLGRDFTLGDLQAQGFAAIFVGIGAQLGSLMRAEGEELEPEGYHLGIDFLRKVNLGEPISVGREAVVVGGGNVAMDCARSALRLGAERVHLVYRRTRDEMPADKLEVHDAEEEGVVYHFLCNPTRLVIEDGRLTGVECVRMGQGEPDASGRRRPVALAGSEYVIPCDMVIPAIGQKVDTGCLDAQGLSVAITKWGTLEVDPDTLATNIPGIFAGGDCASGPATLIEAMAAGMRVSHSIDQYIREGRVTLTEDERLSRVYRSMSAIGQDAVDRYGEGDPERIEMPMRSVTERIHDFSEVETGISPEDALLEADRCLRCYRILLVDAQPNAEVIQVASVAAESR